MHQKRRKSHKEDHSKGLAPVAYKAHGLYHHDQKKRRMKAQTGIEKKYVKKQKKKH